MHLHLHICIYTYTPTYAYTYTFTCAHTIHTLSFSLCLHADEDIATVYLYTGLHVYPSVYQSNTVSIHAYVYTHTPHARTASKGV